MTATNVAAAPDPPLLERVAEYADAGELRVTIDDVYPLERAADALQAFGKGKRGKIAISLVE